MLPMLYENLNAELKSNRYLVPIENLFHLTHTYGRTLS
jgi:hypothetical protein